MLLGEGQSSLAFLAQISIQSLFIEVRMVAK